MIRISRPCYDKYWRCPGWAGGGTRGPKGADRCDGGSLAPTGYWDNRLWKWRLNHCPTCGLVVLPYMVRWLDWRFWGWELHDLLRWLQERAR